VPISYLGCVKKLRRSSDVVKIMTKAVWGRKGMWAIRSIERKGNLFWPSDLEKVQESYPGSL